MGIKEFLFGERKESRAANQITAVTNGQPVFMPDRFESLAAEGYGSNIHVKRCIEFKMRAAGSLKWHVYEKQTDGKRKIIEPTAQAMSAGGIGHLLRIIHQQANEQRKTFSSIVSDSYGFQHVAGDYFIEIVSAGNSEYNDAPTELYCHRPDKIQIVPGGGGVAGYLYDNGQGSEVAFQSWDMVHGRFWNPLNEYYGISPIKAAAMSVTAHNASSEWNVALMQNSARPSGVLVAKGDIDDNAFDRLEKGLDKRFGRRGKARAQNAGRPMILTNGLDWKQMSLSPAEMEWLKGRENARDEIAVAFAIDPIVVGGEPKSYNNLSEAKKGYWEEDGIPLADAFRDELNAVLVARYGDKYYLDYDRDAIPALQENKEASATRANDLWKSNLFTRDQSLAEMKLPPVDNADVYFNDIVFAPVEPAAPVPVKQIDAPRVLQVKAFALETDEQKAAFWQDVTTVRGKWERRIEQMIAGVLNDELKTVIEAVNSSTGIDQVLGKATGVMTDDRWSGAINAAWLAVMEDFGERTLNGLKSMAYNMETKAAGAPREDAVDVFNALGKAYVENVAPIKVQRIAETSRKRIAGIVGQALEDGLTIPEIAGQVQETGEQINAARAMVIARTETLGASSAGNYLMANATGLKLNREWISAVDARTRNMNEGDAFDHAKMNGQTRAFEEPYDVPTTIGGTESLMFPGDPSGSAGNVIQCRCTEGFIPI